MESASFNMAVELMERMFIPSPFSWTCNSGRTTGVVNNRTRISISDPMVVSEKVFLLSVRGGEKLLQVEEFIIGFQILL